MKVAIVHEWFTTFGGSEQVVKAIAALFPRADLFVLVKDDKIIDELGLSHHKCQSSIIQKLPFSKSSYRFYLPLFPFAVEQFDLSEYDLIISSSHVVAKGVLTRFDQLHICYCHSPVRYAWDLYHQYLNESGLGYGLKGWMARRSLYKLRQWDVITANRVTHYLSNSDFTGHRIKKIYNRTAKTIYPPVRVESYGLSEEKEEYYLTCSRFVPYKKIDVIIKAFNKMPDKKLVICGTGPDEKKLKRLASSNVHFSGYLAFAKQKELMQRSKAFVYAAIEDFGITLVEAQACGIPVIALNEGGAREIVKEPSTGLFFEDQEPASIISAVERFEQMDFDAKNIREQALIFSEERFTKEFKCYVDERIKEWEKN